MLLYFSFSCWYVRLYFSTGSRDSVLLNSLLLHSVAQRTSLGSRSEDSQGSLGYATPSENQPSDVNTCSSSALQLTLGMKVLTVEDQGLSFWWVCEAQVRKLGKGRGQVRNRAGAEQVPGNPQSSEEPVGGFDSDMIHLFLLACLGQVMLMDQDTQWLHQLLAEVQLEKFYVRVRDNLNITRMEHFNYVKESDLERIGISKPAQRRLWEALKRYKTASRSRRVR
ncbi:hypothetical protein CCH79_00012972 [Gambusia affinis]|uniref:non-specific protein-tyrosine kinase n=1 Tax=Gambusia affinis TaxID=33528 RepID=A0A315VZI5_GAMAF|nr:hypothetical protein CCH79_00012972 [Gambusia affinis]